MSKYSFSAILLILAGALILWLGFVTQLSSMFTPYLATKPLLLYSLGSGGILLLLIASIITLLISLNSRRKSKVAYGLTAFYVIWATIAEFNSLVHALQLVIAGTLVGGSLLVLGGFRLRPQHKKSATS